MPVDLPQDIRERINEIRADNTSGAAILSRRAAQTLTALAASPSITSAARLHAGLERAARALVEAQPAMAPIFNLANSVLWRAGLLRQLRQIRAAVQTHCREFADRMDASGQQISRLFAALICDGTTVMTHSYSQTVLRALVAAERSGKRFNVICTESRPMREGIALARKLGSEGVRVTVVADAAMLACLRKARMVVVGADSISNCGLVNKTGTSLLAVVAREMKRDFYALCGTEKILPRGYNPPDEAPKPGSEVMEECAPNVTVENFYFDQTPLHLITGVIAEDGILTPEALKRKLGQAKVHLALLSRRADSD